MKWCNMPSSASEFRSIRLLLDAYSAAADACRDAFDTKDTGDLHFSYHATPFPSKRSPTSLVDVREPTIDRTERVTRKKKLRAARDDLFREFDVVLRLVDSPTRCTLEALQQDLRCSLPPSDADCFRVGETVARIKRHLDLSNHSGAPAASQAQLETLSNTVQLIQKSFEGVTEAMRRGATEAPAPREVANPARADRLALTPTKPRRPREWEIKAYMACVYGGLTQAQAAPLVGKKHQYQIHRAIQKVKAWEAAGGVIPPAPPKLDQTSPTTITLPSDLIETGPRKGGSVQATMTDQKKWNDDEG